ncbi:MAG: iron-containing redox enzyme family protein [Thiohalocapsa sp.]|uniref:TenA family transcriptional regulator n=1 Tax=Thiohalocapsa sp. TaxID=2497641 RepID=UPI0025CEEFBD|nr:iron-containing redox enzyme family protein [Thiohalocapsa sp.]MCG6943148.1 iron-containing redox enzyme family protein [Thiohalocapsa sp.]
MSLFDEIEAQTHGAREGFLTIPVVARALSGAVGRAEYIAFLGQAYHHVRHTVPLLMACGARLPDRLDWLGVTVAEYIGEEIGHEQWILDDIAAAGGDREAARDTPPLPATELMVAYAYDLVNRVNPVGLFGMVYVLEGTSVALASRAAETLRHSLGLPKSAFRYLSSHGSLDQAHIRVLAGLLDRLTDPADRAAVTHAASMFYRLYGDIFRSLSNQGDIARSAA